MTIKECIDIVDNIKPNQYTVKEKVMWLSFVDEIIINEVLKTHEGYDGRYDDFEGYSEDKLSVPLIVVSPYDRLYTAYLKMKIDAENGETARYNNSAALYNTYMMEFRKHYNKTHMPINSVDAKKIKPPINNNQIGLSDAEFEKLKRDVLAVLDDIVHRNTSPDRIYDIAMSYISNNSDRLKGPQGLPGKDGKDGYTPVKGTDYTDGRSPILMQMQTPQSSLLITDGGAPEEFQSNAISYYMAGADNVRCIFPTDILAKEIIGETIQGKLSVNELGIYPEECLGVKVSVVSLLRSGNEVDVYDVGNKLVKDTKVGQYVLDCSVVSVPAKYKEGILALCVDIQFNQTKGEGMLNISDTALSFSGAGNWWVWDDASGKYVDTGVKAQGENANDVFIAYYGTTLYEDILNATKANKVVLLYEGNKYLASLNGINHKEDLIFEQHNIFDVMEAVEYVCSPEGRWETFTNYMVTTDYLSSNNPAFVSVIQDCFPDADTMSFPLEETVSEVSEE